MDVAIQGPPIAAPPRLGRGPSGWGEITVKQKHRQGPATLPIIDTETDEPEHVLWRAVLLQALLDATKPPTAKEKTDVKVDRDQARAFLLAKTGVSAEWRDSVCMMARIEPEIFVKRAQELIDSGQRIALRSVSSMLDEITQEPGGDT